MSRMWGFFTGSRKRKIASATGTLALVAGVAFAAWLISSTGAGTGVGGQLQPPVVHPATAGEIDALPASDNFVKCFPGNTCDMAIDVTNPNTGSLVITGAQSDPANPNGTAASFTCGTLQTLPSPVTIQPVTGVSMTVPPGGPTTLVLHNALSAPSNLPTECQNGSFSGGIKVDFSTP